jgi:hypothetical protein
VDLGGVVVGGGRGHVVVVMSVLRRGGQQAHKRAVLPAVTTRGMHSHM